MDKETEDAISVQLLRAKVHRDIIAIMAGCLAASDRGFGDRLLRQFDAYRAALEGLCHTAAQTAPDDASIHRLALAAFED